ncbi:hypothetical protein OROHE_011439 [Orobanche hederae]
MAEKGWLLLDKLKRAVKKIKFIMNFNVNRWKLATTFIRSSSSNRRLSFNDPPGLTAVCMEDPDPNEPSDSSRGRCLQRTISYPSSEDDIDKRADAFIANFYKQLQYERQISLELRYCRGDSLDSSAST